MLRASEWAALRADADLFLPDQAVIVRRTRAADGRGGSTATWAAAGTVGGRIAPANQADERDGTQAFVTQSEWAITVPAGTDVTTADRVTIEGGTYEVRRVPEYGTYQVSIVLECVQVAP